MFIKSLPTQRVRSLITALLTGFLLLAFSFATIPAWAGDAEDNANKAFADWQAANEAVAAAKKDLEKATDILNGLMAEEVESGKKKKEEEEKDS